MCQFLPICKFMDAFMMLIATNNYNSCLISTDINCIIVPINSSGNVYLLFDNSYGIPLSVYTDVNWEISFSRIALSIPRGSDGLDRCHMYDVNYSDILSRGVQEANASWPIVPCRNGWEYNMTEVPYSSIATEVSLGQYKNTRHLSEIVFSQQNWVCENAALPHTAQSIFFCGAILGGLIFGWIADRMGRIPALVGTNFVGFVAGIATVFCSTFWEFCICRFLVGMAFDNCFTMMYILGRKSAPLHPQRILSLTSYLD